MSPSSKVFVSITDYGTRPTWEGQVLWTTMLLSSQSGCGVSSTSSPSPGRLTLTSAGKELHDNFLKALAIREEDNRNGKVSFRACDYALSSDTCGSPA
ncbi:cilia- and flagella-associated protein 299 isoform X1 [Cricetulus griseus]|uniref:cilia- and flagella-associated protein 299 isoform X1 n=1 Tax=Cricetulus griseus TaxID=10029 RepID=UPI0007DA8302|nr:cilia- and flagella-associated protein 299 isoform X1 [Cricetulus griseus]